VDNIEKEIEVSACAVHAALEVLKTGVFNCEQKDVFVCIAIGDYLVSTSTLAASVIRADVQEQLSAPF